MSTEQGRFASLDGLRGLAALAVLLHHSLLLFPVLAAPYFSGVADPAPGWEWLLYSPAHLAWGGTEAVYLFFVLSGFVLAASVRRSAAFDWARYFPSRLVRLYLPVVGAVLFAALTILLVPRSGDVASPWLTMHDSGYTVGTALKDMVLVQGAGQVVTPLWSLQWEVLFSLLLPVAVLLGRGRMLVPAIAGCVIVSTIGFATGVPALSYLAMFGVGAAIATGFDRIEGWATAVSERRTGNAVWAAILVVGILLASSYWLVLPLVGGDLVWGATRPLILVGVTLVMLAGIFWTPLVRILSLRPVRLLGLISFSLYLVHEPIVVAMGYLLDAPLAAPAAIVLSLGIAVLFYLLVEGPAHRLARRMKAKT